MIGLISNAFVNFFLCTLPSAHIIGPTPLGDLQLKVSFNICTLKQMYCSLIALFIYLSEENLRAALGKMGVGGRSMDEVLDKVRNKHYQVTGFLLWL